MVDLILMDIIEVFQGKRKHRNKRQNKTPLPKLLLTVLTNAMHIPITLYPTYVQWGHNNKTCKYVFLKYL